MNRKKSFLSIIFILLLFWGFHIPVLGQNPELKLAFLREDGILYSINLDGSEDTMLANGVALDIEYADEVGVDIDISPTGQILYVDDCEIYLISEEQWVNLTNGNSRICSYSPAWSPDETRIIFCSDPFGNSVSEVYVMSLESPQITRLTNNTDYGGMPHCDEPQMSFDGEWIAFSFPTGMLHWMAVLHSDGSDYQVLAPESDDPTRSAIGGDPAWSPDSQYLAFSAANTMGIYVMNLTGEVWAIEGSINSRFTPSWSSDSAYVTYDALEDIRINSRDGLGASILTRGTHPIWLPHSALIAFINEGNIFLIYSDASDLRQLTTTGDVTPHVLEWYTEN